MDASKRLRFRLRRKSDGPALERLLDELELAAMAAGREMALEFYGKKAGGSGLH